jgi:hypothetical protein
MDFEQRERLIHENFIRKMTTMYLPPNNVKQSDAAKKMYGEELRRAINSRLSSHIPNEDVFKEQLQKVWDKCIAAHDFRIWFTPSLVAKQASKVNADYVERQKRSDEKFLKYTSPTGRERALFTGKSDPASQGWTIENCDKHIANMKRMIEAGEIPKGIGERWIKIPMKAKERLLNQTK